MIELTRLNGSKFYVNCDLIKYIEAAPDTTLTLITGEKLLVAETCDAVIERETGFRAKLLRGAWPDASVAFNARAGHAAFSAAGNRDGNDPDTQDQG